MEKWEAIATKYDPLKAGSIDGTDEYPHDHGVFRAMNCKYKPNKAVIGEPDNTVFVGRLSPHTDEESLEKHFSEYGEIKRLRLVRDLVTGISRCYAFIEFFDDKTAYRTQKNLDKTVLDEKEVYVDLECERTLPGWRPRRLGGGIGGQKESGQLRFGGKNRPFRKPFNIEDASKPEGDTFRERFKNMERDHRHGDTRNRYQDESYRQDRNRYSGNSYKQQRNRRDFNTERGGRSRSRDRYQRSSSRSRNQRSRSRDRRSKSKERSKHRSRS